MPQFKRLCGVIADGSLDRQVEAVMSNLDEQGKDALPIEWEVDGDSNAYINLSQTRRCVVIRQGSLVRIGFREVRSYFPL